MKEKQLYTVHGYSMDQESLTKIQKIQAAEMIFNASAVVRKAINEYTIKKVDNKRVKR